MYPGGNRSYLQWFRRSRPSAQCRARPPSAILTRRAKTAAIPRYNVYYVPTAAKGAGSANQGCSPATGTRGKPPELWEQLPRPWRSVLDVVAEAPLRLAGRARRALKVPFPSGHRRVCTATGAVSLQALWHMLGGGGALGRTVEVWCVRLMCGRHGMLVLASPARDVGTHADAREAETGCCTHVRCDARSPAGDPIRSVRVADIILWTPSPSLEVQIIMARRYRRGGRGTPEARRPRPAGS